jgi:hypothetical protein
MTYLPTAISGATLTLTDGATVNWNTALGAVAEVTLGGNRAIALPTNGVAGTTYRLVLTQDTTGSRTVTWADYFRFTAATAPTLTTTAEYSDILDFYFDGTYYVLVNSKLNFKLFEDPPPPPSVINAIYQIEILLTAPAKTNTQTITTVDTSNAIVIFTGCYCANGTQSFDSFGHLKLTNSTTVTASRDSGNTPVENLTVRGVVIEFASGVIEQKEDRTVSSGSATVATTLTNTYVTSRSCAIYRGHKYSTSSGDTGGLVGVALTSSTQATRYGPGLGASCDTEYTVVQFSATYVNLVQNINEEFAGSTNTTDNVTVTAVDTDNTMLIYNGITDNSGGNWRDAATRYALSSSTNVTCIRNTGTSNTRRACFALIEWVDGVLNSRQIGTIAMNGVATNTATVSSTTTAKTVALYAGMSTNQAATNGLTNLSGIKYTNATTITANKGDNSTQVTAGYGVYEFV